MLKLTDMCCSGIDAIEFFENLAEIIPEDHRTEDFCREFECSLNRFRYEISKSIGVKQKKVKAVVKSYHDKTYCGKCGFTSEEPSWKYCPNCGTAIIR